MGEGLGSGMRQRKGLGLKNTGITFEIENWEVDGTMGMGFWGGGE